MLSNIITKLICEDEDEYHDFKEEWYVQNKKDEMIKDIFSFVNTAHHHDCYLIMGIKNDRDHTIVGIENDKNRYNTQKLTDYLGYLPIANCETPVVRVESLPIEQHTIDVIIIKDFNQVPVYLTKQYRPKKCENIIQPGQIFCRLNNTNTAIDQTAKDYQVEKLWKKRFGLDLPIGEQYKIKLLDIDNWEYFEDGEQKFLYKVDPNYCMYLEKDTFEDTRIKVDSYSLSQDRVGINWEKLTLCYKNREIKKYFVEFLDGFRFLTIEPRCCPLYRDSKGNQLSFRFIFADSFDFYLENFLLNHVSQEKVFTPDPDFIEKSKFLRDMVVIKNNEQLDELIKMLNDKIPEIKNRIAPQKEQIESTKSRIKLIPGFLSFDDDYIKKICMERNLSEYVNDFIDRKTCFERPIL